MRFKIELCAKKPKAKNPIDDMFSCTETTLLTNQSFDNVKRAVLSTFYQVFARDGIIPITFLRKHVHDPSKQLDRVIEELVKDSRIIKQCDSNYEIGIKLTTHLSDRSVALWGPVQKQSETMLKQTEVTENGN